MKQYPDYRDSGVAWLGPVPAHWEGVKLKRVARIQTGVTLGKRYDGIPLVECPYLRVANVQNGYLNLKHVKRIAVPQAEAKAYALRPGDVVVTEGGDIDKLGRGAIWSGQIEDCIHQNHIFAMRPAQDRLLPRFLSLLMESHHGRTYFYLTAKKTTNLASTNRTTLGEFMLFLPPLDEQRWIADYLDAHGRLVQRFIRNRRRLIEVLNEKKQAIIDRLVTRGLDPSVRLKRSGVDWLGDVPVHWDILKLKRVARIDPSRSESLHLRDSEVPAVFLPMERISTDGSIDSTDQRPARSLWQGFTYFRRDDVLVAKITPCFENGKGACLADLPTSIGFGTTELIVLRAGPRVLPQFLRRLTCLSAFRRLGVESMTGAAGQQRVSPDFVANFSVPVPPIAEQRRILAEVSSSMDDLDGARAGAERQIGLLREYRTRLISDVVTGKLDVRELSRLTEDEGDIDVIADEVEAIDEVIGTNADEAELVEEVADADD